jgi:hypothetical protein
MAEQRADEWISGCERRIAKRGTHSVAQTMEKIRSGARACEKLIDFTTRCIIAVAFRIQEGRALRSR